jgi:LPXTG-motif cell wall-anchored protein
MTAESTITNVGTQPNVIATVDGVAVTTGEETAVGNYLVTTADGKLEITQDTAAIVIESATTAWTYDSKLHKDETYTVKYNGESVTAGEDGKTFTLPNGDVITITATAAGVTNVSDNAEKNNTYTYSIKNGTTDTSGNYASITANVGTLTINPKAVTITAKNASRAYTGEALTQPEFEATALEAGDDHTFTVVMTAESTITNVGTQPNVIATVDGVAVTTGEATAVGNYLVTTADGTLKVTANTTVITIESGSASKMFDGTKLTSTDYIVKYGDEVITANANGTFTLPTGDTITINDTSNVVNVYDTAEGNNTFVYELENGEQFTSINPSFGTLTINPRSLILTSASDEKVYDGTPLTNDTVTIGGDGLIAGDTITFDVTGSQLYVGSSDNQFTYKISKASASTNFVRRMLRMVTSGLMAEGEEKEEPTPADNYDITVVYGKLTVTDDVPTEDIIVKTHEEKEYKVGETIEFTISVTNIYDKTVTIVVEEQEGVTITSESEFTEVAPGETITATAEYVVTEEDVVAGSFKNTATARFVFPDGEEKEFPGEDEVTDLEDPKPELTITKEVTNAPAEGSKFKEGETIEYKITVKNSGNLTAYEITVTDELTGDEWTIEELAPGAEKVFKATYKVTPEDAVAGSVVNTATAKGKTKGDDPVVTPGTVETPIEQPKLPKTGDDTGLYRWIATMAMSAAALGFVLIKKKREEEEAE